MMYTCTSIDMQVHQNRGKSTHDELGYSPTYYVVLGTGSGLNIGELESLFVDYIYTHVGRREVRLLTTIFGVGIKE